MLGDLLPALRWFGKRRVVKQIQLPPFPHAGEAQGDGDAADTNLLSRERPF